MDNTEKPYNVLSLCTGYGGIELGLKGALGSITTLANVEIEAFAIANLVNKMETGQMVSAPIWSNLKTFNARIFRGHVDILTGGYPCQPFSAAGKRNGADDPRHLWPYIGGTIEGRQNIIEQCRPRGVFFENVEGHLSLGVSEVLADLERMGYKVEAGIFSAAEVGAPHQRKRVFILGYSEGGQQRRKRESQGRRQESFRGSSPHLWPTRPGEDQHEWEEPRTMANSDSQRHKKWEGFNNTERARPTVDGCEGNKRAIKPQMGRTINGASDRVDRLRLLGNGVVPQTAEKAFRVLHEKLLKRR